MGSKQFSSKCGNGHKNLSKSLNTNTKTNLSRIKQTYSTRPNFLDSRNKTKKFRRNRYR